VTTPPSWPFAEHVVVVETRDGPVRVRLREEIGYRAFIETEDGRSTQLLALLTPLTASEDHVSIAKRAILDAAAWVARVHPTPGDADDT
jgi:hypothetical protein